MGFLKLGNPKTEALESIVQRCFFGCEFSDTPGSLVSFAVIYSSQLDDMLRKANASLFETAENGRRWVSSAAVPETRLLAIVFARAIFGKQFKSHKLE
jgi:hypothetical protein